METDGETPKGTTASPDGDPLVSRVMGGIKTPSNLDDTIVTKEDLDFMEDGNPEFDDDDEDIEPDEDDMEENPELYEDEDDEDEDEEDEDDEEETSEEEVPEVEVKFEPIAEKDLIPKPMEFEQVTQWYEDQYLIQSFRKLGYDIKDDGAGLKEAYKSVRDQDPLYLDNLRGQIVSKAKADAEKYRQTKIEPYIRQQTEISVMKESMRLVKVFPDFFEYTNEMLALQKSLASKMPEVLDDPARALPLLYSMAKEKHGAKSGKRRTVAKPPEKQKPPKMERNRGAQKMRTRTSPDRGEKVGREVDRVFSGGSDPLGFLGG